MLNRYSIIPSAVIGDMIAAVLALLTSLFVRSQALPKAEFLAAHGAPFFFVLLVTLCIFFIIGMYDVFSIVHVRSILPKIGYAQIINAIFAVFLFYVITFWGITPKTVLVLYITFSTLYILVWRTVILPKFVKGLPKEECVLISKELEGTELYSALSKETPYPLHISKVLFVSDLVTQETIKNFIQKSKSNLIIDTRIKKIQEISEDLYKHVSGGYEIKKFESIYEEVFGKVPLSTLESENIVSYLYTEKKVYDIFKRLLDIIIAIPLFVVSLIFYPVIWVLIKIEDRGPLFFTHIRMGKKGKEIQLYKFRSMNFGDTSATWVKTDGNKNKVTKVGKIIRKTRIDELPQLWNVLKGDMSLVGPRPDIWSLGVKSAEEIPFYKARLVVAPGLSGWAQTNMHKPPQDIEETRERLLHDLYYIKNRSLSLDILIVLRTIKTLFSREGM